MPDNASLVAQIDALVAAANAAEKLADEILVIIGKSPIFESCHTLMCTLGIVAGCLAKASIDDGLDPQLQLQHLMTAANGVVSGEFLNDEPG